MKLPPFQLARALDCSTEQCQFNISASDCEPFTVRELLSLEEGSEQKLMATPLQFTDPRGSLDLREEITHLYHHLGRDEVFVCAPQEVMYLALHALLEPGDHVVSVFPAYQPLYQLAESLGCEVSRWEPRTDSGLPFAVDDFLQLLRPTTRLVVINFPHNPSGFAPSRAEFCRLCEAVDRAGAVLFSDEIYRDLAIGQVEPLPSAIDISERAIVLNGLSKCYGLFGLRIGWLAARDPSLLARMLQRRDYTTHFNSAASETLAVVALQNRDQVLDRNRLIVESNLALVQEFADSWPAQLTFHRPTGGSMCLMQLEGLSADEFCRRSRSECDINAVSLSLYDYGDRHIRIGLGHKGLAPALDRLGDLLERMTVQEVEAR